MALQTLLPYLADRVDESGETPEGGNYARFDNHVYFHVVRIPTRGIGSEILRLRFYLFFNPDGSDALPPIDIMDALLAIHLGYHTHFPASVLGNARVRAFLRDTEAALSVKGLKMTAWEVDHSRPLPTDAPRRWAQIDLDVRRRLGKGPDGYDWAGIASEITNGMDRIRQVLEMARPGTEGRSLEPH